MGILFLAMAITFCVLVIIHFVWGIINLIYWLTYGLQSILEGMNFIESVVESHEKGNVWISVDNK